MINSVRQTVMSVLNKNNYGYISPSDFNLYAKQAQLDLFENYFYSYNYQLLKENARQSGSGLADITKGIEEVLDWFSVTKPLLQDGLNLPYYFLPSQTTTNDDYALINKVLIYTKPLVINGTTTSTSGGANKVADTSQDFVASGVRVGDIASTVTNGITYNTIITSVDPNGTELLTRSTSASVWDAIGKTYTIYSKSDIQEAEKVRHSKITMLNNSLLTAPTLGYPAYTQELATLDAYPESINNIGQVVAQYFRYPYVPKWTFITLTNGEPAFDAGQPDYQDFELAVDDEVPLIMKILQYAGMSIREIAAVQFAQQGEAKADQEEK